MYGLTNLEIIEMYKRLRVSDVRDGMDWMGYHHYGSVHHSIKPLYRPETTSVGIARTARYVPYEGPVPNLKPEEYMEWVLWYYDKICYDPWRDDPVRAGDFLCYDIAGMDVGVLGSNCTLEYIKNGVTGFLTNGGGIRDTDECVRQKVNVWSKFVSQGMDQARIRVVDTDVTIAIGGVAVSPGDVIAADGDGAIVVPRELAADVAKYARRESDTDKAGRKKLYMDLGMPLDETVE